MEVPKECQRRSERERIFGRGKKWIDKWIVLGAAPLGWSHLWCSGTFRTFQVLLLGSIKVVVGVIG